MMKEKTTPKSVAPHKVKGAVLFTVVCVMMVLIVFLMGTLALAATANRRANINFQKEQTETIAKTVLTTVADAINADKSGSSSGINAVVANASTSSTPIEMTVTIPGEANPYTVSIRKVNNQRSVFDSETHKFVDCEMYELTTTVATNANNPASESTFSMYLSYGEGSNSTSTSTGGGTGGAFVASGKSTKIGTKGLTTGGTQIGLGTNGTESFEFENTGKVESPIYVNGSLHVRSGADKLYFPGYGVNPQAEYFAVTDDLTLHNDFRMKMYADQAIYNDNGVMRGWEATDEKNWWEIPFVYVGGVFHTESNKVELGDEVSPVNVYCGSLDSKVQVHVNGDLYCFDSGVTSTISGSGGEDFKIKDWAERTYKNKNGTPITTNFGNIYSKGNLDFQKIPQPNGDPRYVVNGDIRCMGYVNFTAYDTNNPTNYVIKVDGDIVATEVTLSRYVTVICKSIYTNTLTNGGTILILQDDGTTRAFNESTDKHTYSAYSGSVYPVGFEESDILEMISPPKADLTSNDPAENVFADESEYPHTLKGYSSNFMDILDDDDNLDLPTISGKLEWGSSSHITTSCILSSSNVSDDTIYIDTEAAGGDITIYIDSSITWDHGQSIVINDKKGNVNFYVANGGEFNLKQGMIITTSYLEKVLGHAPSMDEIKNAKTSQLQNIAGDMTIEQNTTGWAYPKVFLYGESGGKVTIGPNNAFATMNIRAPYVDVNVNNGAMCKTTGSGKLIYKENGITKDVSGNEYAIIGQLIAHDITVDNAFGLLYVTDSAGNGKTILPTVVGGGSYTSKVFRTMYYNFY